MEVVEALEKNWTSFLKDEYLSLLFSFVQFGISLTIFIIGWYLEDIGAGWWSFSDLNNTELRQFFFGMIIMPVGLCGILTSLSRIITFERFNAFYVISFSFIIGIGCLVAGIEMFVHWKGIAYLTIDLSISKTVRMVQSIYLLFLSIGFFVILISHAIRITDLKSIWGNNITAQDNNRLLIELEEKEDNENESVPLTSNNISRGSIDNNTNNILDNDNIFGLSDYLIEYFCVITYFILFLPGMVILNSLLPSDWHRFYPDEIQTWIESSTGYEWTYVVEYKDGKYMKYYFDVLVYYGFIFGISLISYLCLKFPVIKLALRKRFSFGKKPKLVGFTIKFVPFQLSLGELLFWLLWSVMFLLIFLFLGLKHTYDSDPTKHDLETWARTMGVISIIFLSFQIFTVTRIRLWQDCFNLSFEHLISYHRSFSYLMLICGYIHFFLWLEYFSRHSKYSLSSNGPFATMPGNYHSDNFTIQYMYWFMIIIVPIGYLIAANELVRRNYFEVFYYTHLIVSFGFISGLMWHSSQIWRFIIPPLVLYFFDRCSRFIKGTRPVRVVILEDAYKNINEYNNNMNSNLHNYNVTKLSFSVGTSGKLYSSFRPLRHKMAQYCFINIPSIGLYEWHPFTISSHENSQFTTMYISGQGSGTWSQKLYSYANSNNKLSNIELHIDGPYGYPFYSNKYNRIVLCCGGIGITPCHSIFRTLLEKALNNGISDIPYVNLIWCAKIPKLFSIYNETWERFNELQQNQNDKKFTIELRCTRVEEENGIVNGTKNIKWSKGRYKWNQSLPLHNINENRILFACGPLTLVNACEEAAYKFGAHFHSESFEF